MFITLESDYAVRIIATLAAANKKVDAKTISEMAVVTLRFSLKILRKLVASGLVKSYKGTLGGYMLAKKPEEITLKDVIEAIEGTYNFNRCLGDEYDCSRGMSGICCFQGASSEISDMVREKLESYNFKDLLERQAEINKKCPRRNK